MSTSVNILCLHGCNQTSDMFKGLLKSTIEIANTYSKSNNVTFNWHFTEGKYDHPIGGKTWYNKPLEVREIGSIPFDNDLVTDTLDNINKLIDDLNINVLLGFSQGGNVVDTFLVNRTNDKIKCGVIFSGYDLLSENRQSVDIPIMAICSDSDQIVPSKFTPVYPNIVVKKHDKGHKLPTSKPFVREIIEFMHKKCKD
jgi:predicted esterase